MTEQFDVFLCHNSADKPQVRKIAEQLQQYDLKPWLDIWELPPGRSWQRLLEKQIEQINSAAVFVGENGFGPWQEQEIYAFLSEFVNRDCPVIPVLLPNAPTKPELPVFLRQFTWVDFRISNSDPMYRLKWGITGKKPDQQINFTVEIPVVATIEAKNHPPLPVVDLELPGGAMSPESRFYVVRESLDIRCYQEMERKAGLIQIKGLQQMGKTSLLTRIRNHATKQGYRAINLDFLEMDEATFESSK